MGQTGAGAEEAVPDVAPHLGAGLWVQSEGGDASEQGQKQAEPQAEAEPAGWAMRYGVF